MNTTEHEQFRRWLRTAAETLGIALEPHQFDRLWEHYHMVMLTNEDFNLTRVTDPAEAAVRLAGDSLAALPWAVRALPHQPPLRVLDMGTGAGYPAVPLAICRPDWTVTAIDPSGKKARFIARLAAQMGLHNLLVEQIQAREWHGRVQPFDLVVTRALGNLSVCIREGARLLSADGHIVSYHAEEISPAERKAAEKMLKRYKLQEVHSYQYTLPEPAGQITRRLVVIGRPHTIVDA